MMHRFSAVNRLFSALISNLARCPLIAWQILLDDVRSLGHPSTDHALNWETRLEIIAGQPETSLRGGVLHSTPRDARVAEGEFQRALPFMKQIF